MGQEKETISLAYNSALAKKVSNGNSSAVNDSELNDELDSSEATASGNPIIVTFTKSGNAYEIDSNGIIKESTPKDPNATLKVAEHKNEKFSTNTELEDSFGNKITVPAGFKITSDSPDNVTGGIVIEDVDAGTTETVGSQFVWIPLEKIYTDTAKTEANAKTITLGRYSFQDDDRQMTGIPVSLDQNFTNTSGLHYYLKNTYIEETTFREGDSNHNSTAKNINDFIAKSNNNGGYYIGRYEARTGTKRTSSGVASTQLTEKSSDYVYNYVTQIQASERSRNMYASNNYFESDLVNSYAWDTAIVFLQEFDDRTDQSKKYSIKSSLNNSLSETGTTIDIICNIYDMASNCCEWSTESSSEIGWNGNIKPVVTHGDYYYGYNYAGSRNSCSNDSVYDYDSFRPILYVK